MKPNNKTKKSLGIEGINKPINKKETGCLIQLKKESVFQSNNKAEQPHALNQILNQFYQRKFSNHFKLQSNARKIWGRNILESWCKTSRFPRRKNEEKVPLDGKT